MQRLEANSLHRARSVRPEAGHYVVNHGKDVAGGGLETNGYCHFREVPVFVCINVCRDGNQFQVALVLWQC